MSLQISTIALAPPLSDEAQLARAPRTPEELVSALHDRVHRETGTVRAAKSVRTQSDLVKLLKAARPPTKKELREQRISFAFGNASIENPKITREMVEAAAREIDSSNERRKRRTK